MPGRTSKKGFKALLVNHAEKGVFGLAALLGLATLGMTRWSHYDGSPDQITEKVKKSKTELEARTWPEEEQAQFKLSADQLPAQVVYDSLRREYRPEGYPFPMEFSTRFVHALYQRKEPLKEPVLVRLEQPLAASGRVLVQKAPPLMASTEGTTPESEKTETKPKEEFVPDEFRQRNPGGQPGAIGGAAGPGGAYNPMFTAPDLYAGGGYPMGGAYPMGSGEGGAGMAAMPTVEGEGHHYVAVRAVFPVKDQIRKFAEAIQRPFGEAARAFDIIDFQLERQELVSSADQNWSDWTTVDRAAAEQVLTSSDGFDPEVISGTVTNSVMTMPLPKRVFGQWFTDVTHPALEKFQLSDKEVSEQLEFNRKLLEKYLEDQKNVQQPKIQRKGFSGLVFDNREVQSSVMGGSSAYDTSYMGGMAPEMSYGGSGYGGGGYGASGGYGGSGGYAPPGYGSGGMGGGYPMATNAPRMNAGGRGGQMTPEEMMKKLGSGDKKEVDKTLMEFIKTRATVDGELLLFRYIDFAVEPGKTYRYRVRLELINPNFGRQPSEANGEATVVQGETRTSKWSEVTEPTYVQSDVDYFVASVDTRKSMPQARMNMFQWDSKMGTVVQGAVDAYVGQTISGKQKTEVINPPKHTFESEDYTFASKDFVVDAAGDAKLDPKYHTDLKFTTSSGDLGLPARVLVADAVGNLHDLDSHRSASDEKKKRKYMEQQAKAFDYLKQIAAASMQVGGLGEMASPEGMYDMYGGMGGKNKKNNMRKGMGGGSGSGYGSGGYPMGYPGGPMSSGPGSGGSGRRPAGR